MHIPSYHRVRHANHTSGHVHGIGGFASQNSRRPLQLKVPTGLIYTRETHMTSEFCVTTPSRCLTVLGAVGRYAANPGLTPSFRRSLPETGCLSQGLPHGKRYACPPPPKRLCAPRRRPGRTPHRAAINVAP